MTERKRYCLLGEHLEHSCSPLIHRDFGYDYSLEEVSPADLAMWVANRRFDGFNVTIPYKQAIIPYLDHVDALAQKIGAVNTVVNKDGVLTGYNTDCAGMEMALALSGIVLKKKKVVILGSGGTSLTAQEVCCRAGAEAIWVVGRRLPLNYANVHALHPDAQVLINTTPVGMFPMGEEQPLSLDGFPCLEGVMDVIYNPLCTRLLLQARERGILMGQGLRMLVAQACLSRDLFWGNALAAEPMAVGLPSEVAKMSIALEHKMGNLVLIGMPGCGKSTLGRMLAPMVGKTFVDTDLLLEKQMGCNVASLIQNKGIQAFRRIEAQVIRQVASLHNVVIATGGGAVLLQENMTALQQNGRILYMESPLELLQTQGRPLSQGPGAIQALLQEREPLYRKYADWTVHCANPLYHAQLEKMALDIAQNYNHEIIK